MLGFMTTMSVLSGGLLFLVSLPLQLCMVILSC